MAEYVDEITLPQKIKLFHRQLEDIRKPWEEDWEIISEYVQPRREGIKNTYKRGKRKGTKMYDGTPSSALLLLADGFLGYLISPSMQWFRLMLEREKLTELPGVKLWLQECAEEMYSAFHRTNFYEQMHEYFLDGGSIGTATIYTEEDLDQGKIVFKTIHPREIYIAENIYGEVDTVYRAFQLSARNAVEKFGYENLSLQIQKAAKDRPYEMFDFIHAVFPNDKRVYGKLNNQNKKFVSIYIEKDGNEIIKQSGYDSMPFAVWRYRKNSNEWYGRSPAHDALVDIMGLNQMGKDMLEASHLSVKPPYNVPAEMRGRVRITPGGMNYYEELNRIVTPVHTGINYPIGIDREEKKEELIRKHFRVDFFLMLAQAERQMTATEIIERQSEKAAVLGASIGRLQSECLNPIIDRVFEIEYRAGRLPRVPSVLQDYAGTGIRVDYVGPLAQAQRRLFRTQGVTRTIEILSGLLEFKPELADNIDWDVVAREIMDSNNFPQQAIRDPELVARIREARAKAVEAQQRMEQMKQMAEVVPKVSKKVEEGSVLDQLQNAGAGAA